MKKNTIRYLKSKSDLTIKLTEDDVINVIGTKGSGKTTSTLEYLKNNSYIVINGDKLFDLPEDGYEEDKELKNIRDMLNKKYKNLKDLDNFKEPYLDIINFIKEKKKKCIFEGNIIQDIDPITCIKGTLIIKRTSVIKSFYRSVKRDYKNKYFMDLEIKKHGKLGKLYRLNNIIKRRLNIFSQAKELNNIISVLNTKI